MVHSKKEIVFKNLTSEKDIILLRIRILKITIYQNSTKTLQNKKKHTHT